MKLTKAEKEAEALANTITLDKDHVFLVMGPYCWGKDVSFVGALKKAKSNRVRSYEDKRGWWFYVYLAHKNVHIDGMGSFRWNIDEAGEEGPQKIFSSLGICPDCNGTPPQKGSKPGSGWNEDCATCVRAAGLKAIQQ